MFDRGLIIGGDSVDSGARRVVTNPANGEEVGTFIEATANDVDTAVAKALAAQPLWAKMSAQSRGSILSKAAELIDANIDRLAEALTREQGKPFADSKKEIAFGAVVFRYYAQKIQDLQPDVRKTASNAMSSVVRHLPIGIVGAIVPWNYPVDLWCWKVAPALAVGNAVIVKPPLETPLAAGMVAKLIYEAGLPAGLLSDLPGGVEVGQRLVEHPQIRAISATCSTATGKAIMRAAASQIKRLTLELGGNCPFIVLPDADLKTAAQAALRRSFSNAGQICIAVNRIILDESVADEFVAILVELVKEMKIGNGMDPAIGYGPTTTRSVIAKTGEHIEDAVARGAKVVVGGFALTDGQYAKGNFFAPTVVDHVTEDAKIAREETFGPAVAIIRVKGEAEAIRVANDSDYGLAAYVYGRDIARGTAVAEQLQSGGVGVNINDITELDAPFGGWNMSGFGRELGIEGLLEVSQTQHIRTKH
jgi:succinate-semialdehyde dehydrogenase/glutarate-semialdehyde dehydrogenase